MSKIEKELTGATEVSAKRGEERQDYLKRLAKAVNELDDKTFNALSEEADAWVNSAFDALEAKEDIPDFPDAAADEAPSGRRRRGGDEATTKEDAEPKVGDMVKVVTKRDKTFEGKVLEIDDTTLVIKTDDGEEELTRSRLASVTIVGGGKGKGKADDEPVDPVKVGAKVVVITKRDREFTGEIVELDGDVIVLDVDGKDKELDREDIKTITLVGAKPSGRGAAKGDDKGDDKGEAKPTGRRGASTKASGDDDKPSAGIRIRQLCVEMYKEDGKLPPVADVAKALTKEGYEAKDNTVALNYAEASKMFKIIEDAGLLK